MSGRSGTDTASILRILFDQKLAALGIQPTEHDRERLWASYIKQIEISSAWTARLDAKAEPALEFRAVEDVQ